MEEELVGIVSISEDMTWKEEVYWSSLKFIFGDSLEEKEFPGSPRYYKDDAPSLRVDAGPISYFEIYSEILKSVS